MNAFTAANLNETETHVYTMLITRASWQPSKLGIIVNETRTNTYKILEKLVRLGLAEKFDKDKKYHFRATNPHRLLELSRMQRQQHEHAEKELELQVQNLTNQYIKTNDQPGINYYQGVAGIANIFKEITNAQEEVVFIHTPKGIDFYGFAEMHNLRMLAPLAGVKRRALVPDNVLAARDYATSDPQVLLERTWMKYNDYTSPVEWGAYDNKVYCISYGQDAMGIMIESQPIADSFKQLFLLLERGQKLLPDYRQLPRLANSEGVSAPRL